MLTQAQLIQRKQAALALKARVGSDYFRFLGRKGGNKSQFNQLIDLAQNFEYDNREEMIRAFGVRGYEQKRDEMRALFLSRAYERYYDESKGTRVMIALWAPEFQSSKQKKRSRSSKARAS